MTYTYAILDVSCEAYQEIRAKLIDAGHQQAIHGDEAGEVLDMRGIALSEEEPEDWLHELAEGFQRIGKVLSGEYEPPKPEPLGGELPVELL